MCVRALILRSASFSFLPASLLPLSVFLITLLSAWMLPWLLVATWLFNLMTAVLLHNEPPNNNCSLLPLCQIVCFCVIVALVRVCVCFPSWRLIEIEAS